MMAISQLLFQCFIYDKVYDGLRHSSIRGSDSTVKSTKAFSVVHMHGTLEGITAQLPLHPAQAKGGGRVRIACHFTDQKCSSEHNCKTLLWHALKTLILITRHRPLPNPTPRRVTI